MAEMNFDPTQSVQNLMDEIQTFLQTPEDSFSDVSTLCNNFLTTLDETNPADSTTERAFRRLRSRLRVRLNQAQADQSSDRSKHGADLDPPGSSDVEPPTDPLSIQELSSEVVLLRARLEAINDHSPPHLGCPETTRW